MPMNCIASQLCRIFGGAKLDLISKGDQKLTFKDIEGIDQVKERDPGARGVPEEPQEASLTLARARQLASFSWARPGTGDALAQRNLVTSQQGWWGHGIACYSAFNLGGAHVLCDLLDPSKVQQQSVGCSTDPLIYVWHDSLSEGEPL